MSRMPTPVETAVILHPAPMETTGEAFAANYSVQVLRGHQAIMAIGPEITELLEHADQGDNPLLHPFFFLGRVSLFPGNLPVVLLVRSADRLEGAVYLYEKTFCGIPTGYLRGFDHLTGESSVIAREQDRVSILQVAIRQLFLKTGARVAWATVRLGAAKPIAASQQDMQGMHLETGSISREYRLQLRDTFADTLSHFGPHQEKPSLLSPPRGKRTQGFVSPATHPCGE
jgi:hypothetical protein